MNQPRDKGLNGNEKIEQAVAALQQEPTQEQLAHTLTVIRRRIKEHGQLVVAVEPNLGSEQMQLRAIRTADGASWWYAFTSFDEEMKGAEPVQSTFLADMEKLFDAALSVPEISGIILNPWNRTIQLDKTLIRIIKGACVRTANLRYMEETKMFRPMRRASRAIPEEAAKHLLQQSRRGVLAVNGDNGYPFAIPVNYYYDQEHDKIYFHGAKSGQKVDALKQNDKVCFTVYGNEHFEPGDWAPYVQSTVVFGRCHLIDDAAATEARVRELGMKYYPGKEEVEKEIALDIKAVQLYEITIEHLTGKQIQEK